jgi:anti-sigma-K factor RskA
MSPEIPKDIYTQAGEFVLGTLEGEELRQFQAALRSDPEAREALRYWENRLGAWSLAGESIEPPNRVWNAIELGLDKDKASGGLIKNFWSDIRIWRPLAVAAAAAALFLFFFYRQPVPPPVTSAPMVAMLGAEDQAPQFLMAAYPAEHKAMIRILRPMDVPSDKSLELWMVPGEGQVPLSWGLLPTQGERTLIITEREMPFMKSGMVFAVSMEPRGGSPISGPSGPVMYQGKLQRI